MHQTRRTGARDVRSEAAELARSRPHPRHVANGDELTSRHDASTSGAHIGEPTFLASYTKGLAHDETTGLVQEPDDFRLFVQGIDSGDPRDFRDTPLGPNRAIGGVPGPPKWESTKAQNAGPGGKGAVVRAWESASAGSTFDLEGPDAQAVTMPPAPGLGRAELSAEMGEVYVQALLRDIPFAAMARTTKGSNASDRAAVQKQVDALNCLDWFAGAPLPGLSEVERGRRRTNLERHTAFRGMAAGDDVGPYVSQLMLAGNAGINTRGKPDERSAAAGQINYGGISIDQKVRFAKPGDDHMTTWAEWLDVQNGADLRGLECYEDTPKPRRFITTPRDLATYVHFDALYEAYLNACLILLALESPFDPGIPYQGSDVIDHQQGFAHFGGPHILSLLTEVATRALKAVRFQKFNVHRRLRPEALAGRIKKVKTLASVAPGLQTMTDDLSRVGILGAVKKHNAAINGKGKGTHLLPMAFCEGSPMHPSYGAGHATVAGACVTILKAFFDHGRPLDVTGDGPGRAFVPRRDGARLEKVDVLDARGKKAGLTVEGELNKLAANISIGRDWAGVHYFTDYIESLRMGEQIAIGILEEQKLTYRETFSMTVPLYDGGTIRI